MENDLKVHIGGIKFSEELVQVTVCRNTSDEAHISQLFHLIAEQQINLPFLCHSELLEVPETIFCVESSDHVKVQQLFPLCSLRSGQIDILPAVGTLTLFPHRNSFRLLGLILELFGQHKIPLHSFCTSISAIALNTDYIQLDEVAEQLQSVFSLPENHAPFRQGFRLTQIEQR